VRGRNILLLPDSNKPRRVSSSRSKLIVRQVFQVPLLRGYSIHSLDVQAHNLIQKQAGSATRLEGGEKASEISPPLLHNDHRGQNFCNFGRVSGSRTALIS